MRGVPTVLPLAVPVAVHHRADVVVSPAALCTLEGGAAVAPLSMATLLPFLQLVPTTFRGAVCSNGETCRVRQVLASMPSVQPGQLRPLCLPFVARLRTSTVCVLCHEMQMNEAVRRAMWDGTPLDTAALPYRHMVEPGRHRHMIPQAWMARVGVGARLWWHEMSAWSVVVDSATATRTLQRIL
jgi:hypothetical protein